MFRKKTSNRCACNQEKEGMVVGISISQYSENYAYEVELRGELPDGTWITLTGYAMPDDVEEGLKTIPRLLATWEFIANHDQPTNQIPKP